MEDISMVKKEPTSGQQLNGDKQFDNLFHEHLSSLKLEEETHSDDSFVELLAFEKQKSHWLCRTTNTGANLAQSVNEL